MGDSLMDILAIDEAAADAAGKYAFTNPQVSALHRVFAEATRDQHWLILSDSTAAGLTRWGRLMGDRVAERFTPWGVQYRPFADATKTWPVGDGVNVQAGTNGRTVTIWNAALSGSAINYARDNMGTITAPFTAPDVIFVNYGHNSPQLGDDYRAVHLETVLQYQRKYPKALIVLMTQNPRALSDPAYGDGQSKNSAIYDLAVSRGFCIVDVNRAFIDYGNYAADLLLPDGLHPNDAKGSPMWADLVWRVIKPTGVTLTPGPQPVESRKFIPASQFYLLEGAPTLVLDPASKLQCWAFRSGFDDAVACATSWNDQWKRQNAFLIWLTPTSVGTGKVIKWETKHMYVDGGSVGVGAWSNPLPITSTAPATSAFTRMDQVWNRNALGRAPLSIQVKRYGTDAANTLLTDALLFGMLIETAY